jgi:ribonuclease D
MPVSATQPLHTVTEIVAATTAFSDAPVIAVDTEFNRTSTYRPELCLLQLAAAGRDVLVDMLAAVDFSAVRELLVDGDGLKLFHAAKQDLEALQLNLGWLPNRIFDTQIAAGLLGHPPQAGYGTLVDQVLGLQLDKSATRTDWSKRPLSDAQLHYAREDVIHLLSLYGRLREELLARDRYEWAVEDSAALLDPGLYLVAPEAAWQRLGGLSRQPAAVQARARALAAWREARAQQVNRPRQWVLSDKALLNIARANPADSATLARVAEVPPAVVRRQGPALLEAVEGGNAAVARDAAEFERRAPPPPDAKALKALARLVDERAGALGLAPETLATRRELAGLLRGEITQRVTSGWRRAVIGAELLSAL